MFRFKLELATGEPADPPTFATAHQPWHVGDTLLLRPGAQLRIVAMEGPAEGDPFDGVWTVEGA